MKLVSRRSNQCAEDRLFDVVRQGKKFPRLPCTSPSDLDLSSEAHQRLVTCTITIYGFMDVEMEHMIFISAVGLCNHCFSRLSNGVCRKAKAKQITVPKDEKGERGIRYVHKHDIIISRLISFIKQLDLEMLRLDGYQSSSIYALKPISSIINASPNSCVVNA